MLGRTHAVFVLAKKTNSYLQIISDKVIAVELPVIPNTG